MEVNNSREISPSISWETGKAVIRGKIISHSTNKKKKKNQELQNHLEQAGAGRKFNSEEKEGDRLKDVYIKLHRQL